MNIGKISSAGNKMPLMTRFVSSPAVRKTVTELGKNVPMITVISVVSKDLVGALVLFYQTYHNKLIPEKKRKYLASYELTSGAYNVAFPLTVGAILTNRKFKYQTAKAAFKKFYVKSEVLEKAKNEAKTAVGAAKVQAQKIIDKNTVFEKCNAGLTQFIAVIFTAIISKRIICPFVGGPLATVFNKNVLQKNEAKQEQKEKQALDKKA
jgi:hypothetical protein